ncbi:hypothetical protein GPALN_007843 [Globodera pallida]|nr:hypothetical protein GPALN_007843 [Globodera pallida]
MCGRVVKALQVKSQRESPAQAPGHSEGQVPHKWTIGQSHISGNRTVFVRMCGRVVKALRVKSQREFPAQAPAQLHSAGHSDINGQSDREGDFDISEQSDSRDAAPGHSEGQAPGHSEGQVPHKLPDTVKDKLPDTMKDKSDISGPSDSST